MIHRKIYVPRLQVVTITARPKFYLPVGDGSFRDAGHYSPGLESFTKKELDLVNDVVKCRMIRTSAYTYSATHSVIGDIPAAIVTDVTLGTKTVSGGTLDAANGVFAQVPAGAAIDGLVFWDDTHASDRLLWYMDGFSVTPNGGDITFQWPDTSPFIAKI